MILETIKVGPMEANCYILASGKNQSAIIIDPGAQERKIRQVLDKHGLKPGLVINTHGHYDHIGCDDKFAIPVYVHKDDFPLLKDASLNLSGFFAMDYEVESEIRIMEDGQVIKYEGIELKVLHIPGHTPGGVALLLQETQDKAVFTGDTLFHGGIGRSDLAGGSETALIKAIKEKLLTLPEDTVVYPGHGSSSTIAEEKRHNPFLG